MYLKISMNVRLFAVLVVRCESVTIEFVLRPVINGEKQSSPRAELSGPVNIFSTSVRQSKTISHREVAGRKHLTSLKHCHHRFDNTE